MWDFFGNLFVASLFGFLQFIIAFYAAGYYEYHSNSGISLFVVQYYLRIT